MSKKRTRILTGIKPTADAHIGNYFGAIKPCIEYSKNPEFEVILMCVDWHGLTDKTNIMEPGKNSTSMLASFLAFGYEPKDNSIILQSDFPQIQENAWYLSCATAVGMLERAHAYKDALQNNKQPTAGLFFYPVLMASDIVTFDADVVPVGKDQAQHLEYASDIAKLFNNAVGKPVFKEPKPMVQDVPLLIGTDGEKKMSKSYDNYIPMFGPKKDIEKRIKAIKTDSKGVDDAKDPDTCPIFNILKAFGSDAAIQDMHEKLKKGKGYGYGHAKMDLIAEHERVFGSKREAYEHYCNTPKALWEKMEPGYQRATTYANQMREKARTALDLRKFI